MRCSNWWRLDEEAILKYLFGWTSALSVNVDVIDEQHQELLNQINGFFQAVLNGKGLDLMDGTMDFLLEYVDLHFRTEEYFMEKYQYPFYAAHKTQHEQLSAEVLNVARRIRETEQKRDVVVELVQQMGAWVVEHVMRVDTNLGRYLDSLGRQLDTRLPDELIMAASKFEPLKSLRDKICGHFGYCSKMFDNFLEDDNRRFWMDGFCRHSGSREQCLRKQKLDRGPARDEVPKTMLPNGSHLPHLARI
jgi:hemerythrin